MEERKNTTKKLFKRILNLRIGEALLFAPSALLGRADGELPEKFQIKVRKRLTWDGGKSIVCV